MLSLRKATIEDLDFLFNLRNEESVRRVSLHSQPITLEEHSRWLERKLASGDTALLIAEIDAKPMAQVRFDIKETEAEVSIAVVKDFRGKGYGTEILEQSAKLFFQNFPAVKKIKAFINLGNDASTRSFSKAGYQDRGQSDDGGLTRNLMILERK